MIGTLNRSDAQATVIGAGVAGLLAAYELDRQGYQVTLIEAGSRAGGMIRTTDTPWGITESAAHSFLMSDSIQDLCWDLDVTLLPVRETAKSKYILRAGKLRRFPLRPFELGSALVRAALIPATDEGEQTMEEWARRHLGDAALGYLFNPLVHGIYGACPSGVSVEAAFPNLKIRSGRTLLAHAVPRMAFRRGKKKQMGAPQGGMGELISKLESSLKDRLGDRFRLGTPVTNLPEGGNVILCTDSRSAAALIRSQDVKLADLLAAFPYTSLTSVTAFLKKGSLPDGVGVLIPRRESQRCLGILFNSSAFPGRVKDPTHASLTLIFSESITDRQILERCVGDALWSVLGTREKPLGLIAHPSERAIPLYSEHALETWSAARAGWCATPGRVLFGNYTGQVSLRGMIDSLSALR